MGTILPAEQMEGSSPEGARAYESDKPQREAVLDDIVSRSTEEAMARHAEREDFSASREAREAIRTRYGEEAGNAGKIIESFLGMHEQFKSRPDKAADDLAASYLRGFSAHGQRKLDEAEKPASNAPEDESDPLDKAITSAVKSIENRDRDEREFAASKEQREALKKLFPHMSISEAFKNIDHLDRSLSKDPIGNAMRIAASYGAPITPGQIAAMQATQTHETVERSHESMIQEMEAHGELPNLPALESEILKIMSEPNFPWTGHAKADLRNAHAEATRRTVQASRVQHEQRETIEKAKRAAPIKTSGGYSVAPAATAGDLDSIIRGAIG